MRKCRFPGRRRSRNHDEFDTLASCDVLCNPSNSALLHRLLYQNQLCQIAAADLVIQISNRRNAELLAPARRILQRFKKLFSLFKNRQLLRIAPFRKQKHQSVLVREQVKTVDIARIRHHVAIIIIIITVQLIHIDTRSSPVTEQLHLIRHSL
ncbi:unknown [Firmicutes bacterium CAG:24]|nr:unknown [Firmicutes bacterium CAG:24]